MRPDRRLFCFVACVSLSLSSVACMPTRARLCWTFTEPQGSYLSRPPERVQELVSLAEASSKSPLRGSQFWFRGQDSLSLCNVPLDCGPRNCTAQRFDYKLVQEKWSLIDSSEIVNVTAD